MTASVLFVCLGNICRSPLAEAALREEATRRGLAVEVDSAGTGNWHAGEPPDPRAVAEAAKHGADISGLRARQVTPDDFFTFTEIVALDRSNLRDLQRIAPDRAPARLSLAFDHVPGRRGEDVADPWFGDASGFETTWADVGQIARALAGRLQG
jgi:protein-tyrosine phosphatase